MDTTRKETVRLDVMDRATRYAVAIGALVILGTFALIGQFGPTMLQVINPSKNTGVGIDLTDPRQHKLPPNHCYADAFHKVYDEPIPHCWRHEFYFVNPYSNYFTLDMVTHRYENYAKFDSLQKVVEIELELYGIKDDQKSDPVLIAHDVVKRTIVCDEPYQPCKPTVLFTASHIVFNRYRFQMRLPESSLESYSFINATDITFSYEGFDYALLELILKYLLQAATLFIVYPLWWYSCTKYRAPLIDGKSPLGLRQRLFPFVTVEQKWVAALMLGSIAFCNPLAFLDYNESPQVRRIGEVLAVMAQFTYVCLLLGYWLVAFDSLITEDSSYRRSKKFWLPKAIFCVLFWFIGVSLYGWITVNSIDYPLYNWYEDEVHFYLIKVYIYTMGVVYVLWVFALAVRGASDYFRMSNASAFIYTQHLLPLTATLIGLIGGHIFDIDVHDGAPLVFFHALFVFYPWQLAFLYTPFPATEELQGIMMQPLDGTLGPRRAVSPQPRNGAKPLPPNGSNDREWNESDAADAGLGTSQNIVDVTLA